MGLVSIVLALGFGFFYYDGYFTRASAGAPPKQQIDVISIKSALQVLGQAERRYQVTHGSYATLEQLKEDDLLPPGLNQRGYTFTSDVNGGTGFSITATPADPAKAGWPTLVIDQTMQIGTP
jgi:hypothetical protein